MQKIIKIAAIREFILIQQTQGKQIGFVPTMGALHDGHASLIKASKTENDITICSIFINPIQFNNPEDLEKYPVKTATDCHFLDQLGCDVVFIPERHDMYHESTNGLKMSFGEMESVMEGKFRPGHFSGVGVVVSKLLNIIQPHKAYFGQKDLQQLAIIKKLVADLNFQTKIVGVPTQRESNGLAMSSRNLRLSLEEKNIAAMLYREICSLKKMILNGNSIEESITISKNHLTQVQKLDLEYLEVVESNTLISIPVFDHKRPTSICAAANIAGVRIIDNINVITSS